MRRRSPTAWPGRAGSSRPGRRRRPSRRTWTAAPRTWCSDKEEQMNIPILDDLPLASVLTVILALVGGVVCIVSPDVLSYDDYLKGMGAVAAGSGVLGIARNQSGRGLKK